MDLTDKQWALIEPLFETKRRADGRGRPWRDPRDVLNGVLWVLRTGAPWKDLRDRYPPYQTCLAAFSNGHARASCETCSNVSPRICDSAASSISPKALSTPPTFRRVAPHHSTR